MSKLLEDEISRRIEESVDSVEHGLCDEPMTRGGVVKELIQDCDVADGVAYDLRDELREIGIMFGVFVEMTSDELSRTFVSRGRKYDFKRGGKMYRFESWDRMIAELK